MRGAQFTKAIQSETGWNRISRGQLPGTSISFGDSGVFDVKGADSVKPGCVPNVEDESEDYTDEEFHDHQKGIYTPNKGNRLGNAPRLLDQQRAANSEAQAQHSPYPNSQSFFEDLH